MWLMAPITQIQDISVIIVSSVGTIEGSGGSQFDQTD